MGTTTKAVVYARQSPDRLDSSSVVKQTRNSWGAARKAGWTVLRIAND